MKILFRLNIALAVLAIAASSGCSKKKPATEAGSRPRFAQPVYNNDAPPLDGAVADGGESDQLPYDEFSEPLPPLSEEADNAALASLNGETITEEGIAQSTLLMNQQPAGMIADLQTIYFALDSAELGPDTMASLDANAQWMVDNPAVHVQIEGHCDESGTAEYNISLGQLRADIVREYLTTVWQINPMRLHTISYGEERPVSAERAQNRRAQFLVYDQAAGAY